MQDKMQVKTRHFKYLVNFMQRRMRDKCATIDAKKDVMMLAWDKYVYIWGRKAVMYKDEGMKHILESLKTVKP